VGLAQIQLALMGALPALAAMLIFDRLDAKRPEPRSTLRRVALAGGLSAIPVIIIGELLKRFAPAGLGAETGPTTYAGAAYMAFVIAAIPEELAKLGSMWLFAWRRPEFDERMDGIVYGARAGLGFALVENVAYLLLLPGSFSQYISLFVGRAVLAVPGHATWGAIIGYYAAKRRFDGRGPGMIGGYLLAVLLHGCYDMWLFSAPVAMADGITWIGLGIGDVPIIAYTVPALIVGGGVLLVRSAMGHALAGDDAAEAHAHTVARQAADRAAQAEALAAQQYWQQQQAQQQYWQQQQQQYPPPPGQDPNTR
jgi:RsiW-degrading membrane proteinase PrsW (M82 family)